MGIEDSRFDFGLQAKRNLLPDKQLKRNTPAPSTSRIGTISHEIRKREHLVLQTMDQRFRAVLDTFACPSRLISDADSTDFQPTLALINRLLLGKRFLSQLLASANECQVAKEMDLLLMAHHTLGAQHHAAMLP